ncbi:hypothetical protein RIF29_20926 [Crotalaria pallida]|uniref:Uncharacterized protein n=1 Tax=Crotalaria pallida TaxID=3830 RepID=A0AAN9F5L1_CROPI
MLDNSAWLLKFAKEHDDSRFLVILWWIWHWRCAVSIGQEDWSINQVCRSITDMYMDLKCFGISQKRQTRVPRVIAWLKPGVGCVKLNVDGSFREGDSKAGGAQLKRLAVLDSPPSVVFQPLLADKMGLSFVRN